MRPCGVAGASAGPGSSRAPACVSDLILILILILASEGLRRASERASDGLRGGFGGAGPTAGRARQLIGAALVVEHDGIAGEGEPGVDALDAFQLLGALALAGDVVDVEGIAVEVAELAIARRARRARRAPRRWTSSAESCPERGAWVGSTG
jgi:hypothetical protein